MTKKLLATLLVFALLPACSRAAENTERPAGTTTEPPPRGKVSVEVPTFQSKSMGGEWGALVVLPAAYGAEPERRFPVLYLLHGAGGDHASWARGTDLIELLEKRPLIVVCPNGRRTGWYVDSHLLSNSQVETHIVKELVPFIDGKYRTVARASARGISGFSMGGHGAVTLAAKHPGRFCSASSLSGIMDITRWPRQWGMSEVLGPLFENRALWKAQSATGLAKHFGGKDSRVRLLIDCGTDDFAFRENREFHEQLTRLEIKHVWRSREGGHDFRYWRAHLAEHLDFHLEAFEEAEKARPKGEAVPAGG